MRSTRMLPVARHADQKQQEAVQVYAQAQRALEDAQLQLQQLVAYREEYARKMSCQRGLPMEQLRNFQAFVQQLGRAIKQAELDIESHKQACEHRKQQWLKTRARSQALHRVVEKYQIEERVAEDRREQKEMDEHAQRLSRNPRD